MRERYKIPNPAIGCIGTWITPILESGVVSPLFDGLRAGSYGFLHAPRSLSISLD